MKIRQILLTGATVMLLTASPVWAARGEAKKPIINEREHGHRYGRVKAPEIDATSGTRAIALLTGVLLLVGEKSRARRS